MILNSFVGQIHVYLMGIVEPLCLIPDGILFLRTVIPDLHDRGRRIYAFALLEYRNQKFPQGIGAAPNLCFFSRFPGGSKIIISLLLVKGFVRQTDQIRPDFSRGLVVNPVDGFIARVRDLFRIFGKLDLGDEFSLFILDGRQLVHAAEGRAVPGGDQVGSHAPGGDGCPPGFSGCRSGARPDRWRRR